MDIPAMFCGAVAQYDARVRQIGGHQWQAATPDEDWAVRDLVNHIVGEDLWAPPLLAGSTIAAVGDRFDGDVVGADPRAAWTAASAGAVRAVGEPGAMDRVVHLSFGDVPGREYTLQLFAGHLIHAWDLARAIGVDERLDAGLVASCATWFDAAEDAYRGAGAIAARARSRRGCRCPVMRTPRWCCWPVSASAADAGDLSSGGGQMKGARVGYDVIVAGGGSAGCVAAARLSADDRCRVLLLEAGPDYPAAGDLPADVADGSMPATSHDWGFMAEPDEQGRSVQLLRGRLMGGCSATNACFALRGWPQDYDQWAARGNPGWSFADLLPVFRAVESDADFGGDWHGVGGPVPVRRLSAAELSPWQRAFADAADAAGHRLVGDHNEPGMVGAGPAPRNVRDGLRMSTALTHLAAARGRPNLAIRAGAAVDRVELHGTAASGVRLVGGEIIEADAIVVTAGSYASPAILMRSGIGPAAALRDLGIGVAADLPGVGENLIDHPLAAVDLPTTPGFSGPRFQVMLTLRSALADPDGPPDLHLFAAGPFDDAASPAGGVFGIVAGLLAVRSRGSVRLRSADPADPPRIDIAHLRDLEDMTRMIEAIRHARQLSRTPPLAGFVTGAELAPGPAVSDDDTAGLARSIRERVESYHHPVGTCAMGPRPGDGAVVDARGAVHGIESLWVADASVMPAIPAAGTNLTTIVIAERIAHGLSTP